MSTLAPTFVPGATATITHRVRPEDAADAWGNDLPVLSTPVLLWLSEIAAMKAVEDAIPGDFMTVGSAHDSSHLAPTLTGEEVTVRATLVEAGERSLLFEVEASDPRATILSGRHRRGVVPREKFLAKLDALRPR
ncbi:thioesterase family protein [Nocardia sp. NPDC003482]